ncbi:glycosyltransferase involved in cell wall biosynthesis [Croceifilum oryzae]|uniref:Glycosyltransferase involved in cell wall biosynthesis n=1 Tax=Croceifilum oryzae TaxID=1553429 RepID=A0AAJ1TJ15_9BACL|nr:glycosyl transferase family 1 [Croceifilum oryzae]MDQ0417006.1 glycosyltransferase involved in cell wall biosynthesis [Croceifilum oryzae]
MAILIYPPTIDWTWMKQRPQQILSQFAADGHTVYYANRTQTTEPLTEVRPRLYVVSNWDVWVNEELPIIQKASQEPIGIWCSNPLLAKDLPDHLVDWVVYDCLDDFAQWHPYEPEMLQKADVIFCTSERIYKRFKRISDLPIYLVRNGYDPSMELHLLPATAPSSKPILGYMGAWAPWVHLSILQRCAQLPNATVQVIGPEFGSKFVSHPTIQFLDNIPHHQLNQHIQHFSVCLIPFRINAITLATNPIKAYEYLASGKPVISTALPECRGMSPYIDIAENMRNFVELVEWRLKEPGDAESRIQYALSNTWEHRYFEIKQHLPNHFLS